MFQELVNLMNGTMVILEGANYETMENRTNSNPQ